MIKRLTLAYVLASLILSTTYNLSNESWKISTNRNGLLIIGIQENSFYILSPLNNHEDSFLIGYNNGIFSDYTF